MSKPSMTPQESLSLITSVIQEARQRHEENGLVYLFWGSIVAMVSLAHFTLIQIGSSQLIFVPYLLMPLAGVASYLLFYRGKKAIQANLIGILIRNLWLSIGINMLFLGFVMWDELGEHLIPVILLLLGIALSLSGAAISSKLVFRAGIIANLAGVAAFWVPYPYQPLLMALINIFAVALPGALLYQSYRKKTHV